MSIYKWWIDHGRFHERPHIRLESVAYSPFARIPLRIWTCTSSKWTGYGYTAEQAYNSWLIAGKQYENFIGFD